MLRYRLIFGPFMIALLVGLVHLDERVGRVELPWAWWPRVLGEGRGLPAGLVLLGMVLVLVALASGELCSVFRAKGIRIGRGFLVGSAWLVCVAVYLIPTGIGSGVAVGVMASVLAGVLVFGLWRHVYGRRGEGRVEGAVVAGAAGVFAAVYLGVLPGFYLAIRTDHSAWLVACVMLIPKTCDIGAYFVGRAVGRHKLIPWLSPGKTWEGLLGGVAVSAGVAAALVWVGIDQGVFGRWVARDGAMVFEAYRLPLMCAAGVGALLGVVGQIGDLTVSLFKRDATVKDSGSSVPGFGGVLDVVDSPILVAPFAYWLLKMIAVICSV